MHRFAGRRVDSWVRVVRAQVGTRPKRFGRLVMVGLLVPYVCWLTFGYEYHFIDGVNLLIHEAGHVLFIPLGETWSILGGTLLQIAIPLAFCAHFVRRGDRFSGAVIGVWLAESVLNVARYMGDAVGQELPLIGGGIHDWHWLLANAGLLRHTEALGVTTHLLGVALAVVSVWFAWEHRNYARPILGLRGDDDPEIVTQREEELDDLQRPGQRTGEHVAATGRDGRRRPSRVLV